MSSSSRPVRRRPLPTPPAAIDTEYANSVAGSPGSGHGTPIGHGTPMSGHGTPRSTLGSPLTSQAGRMGDFRGPKRRRSLSEVEICPWICCMAPVISYIFTYGTVVTTWFFSSAAFSLVTLVLTIITLSWLLHMVLAAAVGTYYLRRDTAVDWHALLEKVEETQPDTASGYMHIVILPNFNEHEKMLKNTLENIANSPLAIDRMRIVLGMESREGDAGRQKADRLIAQTKHLFADIFATYHPDDLPCEVKGKSSNTQWAFREAMRTYRALLDGYDASKVFLTVGDADTLWHPQYWSCLAYSGLTMPKEEAAWRIWQPPCLMLRNLPSVPVLTRVSSQGAIIFELGGLAFQGFFPALAYSAYSLTLALASHPEVDGWDVDVIAEDHHMWCKCFFAALWEQAHELKAGSRNTNQNSSTGVIVPKLKVVPIFLPAISFAVESSDGQIASVRARFHQARRHCQGVVELGYVALQYVRFIRSTGAFNIPARTHLAVWSILVKLQTLHITTTAQALALMLVTQTMMAPAVLNWIMEGGLFQIYSYEGGIAMYIFDLLSNMEGSQQALITTFSQMPVPIMIMTFVITVVVIDLQEGKYYEVLPKRSRPTRAISTVDEGSEAQGSSGSEDEQAKCRASIPDYEVPEANMRPACVTGKMTSGQKIMLFVWSYIDTNVFGYATIFVHAIIPMTCTVFSLLRRGTDFEYIVADKPE